MIKCSELLVHDTSNSIILPTGCEWVAMVETILSALAPIVFTLLLGFVAAWRHDFGPKEASVLNRMVLWFKFTQPVPERLPGPTRNHG
jgi:hypothetical protein